MSHALERKIRNWEDVPLPVSDKADPGRFKVLENVKLDGALQL
jgi:hypothetical protein